MNHLSRERQARAPSPLVISADAAAQALQEYFLANADSGDNAANDELVTALVHRLRTGQARGGGVGFPRTAAVSAPSHRGDR